MVAHVNQLPACGTRSSFRFDRDYCAAAITGIFVKGTWIVPHRFKWLELLKPDPLKSHSLNAFTALSRTGQFAGPNSHKIERCGFWKLSIRREQDYPVGTHSSPPARRECFCFYRSTFGTRRDAPGWAEMARSSPHRIPRKVCGSRDYDPPFALACMVYRSWGRG